MSFPCELNTSDDPVSCSFTCPVPRSQSYTNQGWCPIYFNWNENPTPGFLHPLAILSTFAITAYASPMWGIKFTSLTFTKHKHKGYAFKKHNLSVASWKKDLLSKNPSPKNFFPTPKICCIKVTQYLTLIIKY